MDKFTGSHGVRFINPTDRKFEPRMTPLQLAGEVVGALMIVAVFVAVWVAMPGLGR